ncbi:MAG: hypothetical protein QOJ32_1673 [Frankiaceae bacterium]|nr:hypothetical protein [Frankiaceae bacterium]
MLRRLKKVTLSARERKMLSELANPHLPDRISVEFVAPTASLMFWGRRNGWLYTPGRAASKQLLVAEFLGHLLRHVHDQGNVAWPGPEDPRPRADSVGAGQLRLEYEGSDGQALTVGLLDLDL